MLMFVMNILFVPLSNRNYYRIILMFKICYTTQEFNTFLILETLSYRLRQIVYCIFITNSVHINILCIISDFVPFQMALESLKTVIRFCCQLKCHWKVREKGFHTDALMERTIIYKMYILWLFFVFFFSKQK